NGWSIPAPAPWPTTSEGARSPPSCHAALTSPFGVAIRNRSLMACHDARRERSLLPRHLRIRLRRMAQGRLLPRGPQEGRHARLLLDPAVLGRDQLHLPPVPERADGSEMACEGRRGVRVHAEGEPTDHALEEAERRRRRRDLVRRAREAARRSLRVRALPMPTDAGV